MFPFWAIKKTERITFLKNSQAKERGNVETNLETWKRENDFHKGLKPWKTKELDLN